jgi:hypothetical protein
MAGKRDLASPDLVKEKIEEIKGLHALGRESFTLPYLTTF